MYVARRRDMTRVADNKAEENFLFSDKNISASVSCCHNHNINSSDAIFIEAVKHADLSLSNHN